MSWRARLKPPHDNKLVKKQSNAGMVPHERRFNDQHICMKWQMQVLFKQCSHVKLWILPLRQPGSC
eukprot:3465328-Amphidinium_carterae.2